MSVKQNLYQIFKIGSQFIVENNCDIKNYTKSQANREGTLVSIGDNQVFYQIRKHYGDTRNHLEIFKDIQNLRRTLKICKKEGKTQEAKIINRRITDILFVKDIVNVKVENKTSYKQIMKNGFYLNGIHFIRFLAGAGQIRRNTITFINEELYQELTDNLMCDLLNRTKEFNLAKLSAYFALSFSSVLWVRTPRVCVVKDFFNTLPKQKVDFIKKDQNGKSVIEEREMDIELNCADGQGLIDPEFSNLWAQDMDIGYVPSSFVVRSVFIKGNLVPFDFKHSAQDTVLSQIKDRWGNFYNIEDIDVILSESQFKMYKYYKSWEEYKYYADKADIKWGVARYNRKYDDEYVLANYQYIQALDLSKEEIKELIQPTVEYIQKICSGDKLYAMLYLFGCSGEGITQKELFGKAQSLATKAVVKNNEFLKDSYVQQRIYKNIIETINRAKIGKIWLRGNYQFMISDPIAQCQSALGLPVKGEVPANCVWSNFWNVRGVKGFIDCCRSPLIDISEHNPSELYQSEKTEKWYQHIKSGMVYSIYDTATFKHADSDFDGDIVLSTDNKYFLKGVYKNQNMITYEKGAAPSQKINISNFGKTDIRGLGTGVGGFSNIATIFYAMKGLFNKENQKDQKEELSLRIKLLREIVGQEIDRIKGTAAPVVPSEWKKKVRINEDDTDAVKAGKYKHNSMVMGNKKPYFFRYLYPHLNQQFKQYENGYNIVSKLKTGLKFKKLLAKPNKTEEEMNIVRRYNKYSPLITAPCNMNILCREIENIDFDIKFNKNTVTCLPDFKDDFEFDTEKFKKVKTLYQTYVNSKFKRFKDELFGYRKEYETFEDEEKFFESKINIYDLIKQDIAQQYDNLQMDYKEFLFYTHRLAQHYSSFYWSFPWDVLGEQILEAIPAGISEVPVRNEKGQYFLGERFILEPLHQEIYDVLFNSTELNSEQIEEYFSLFGEENGLSVYEEKFE